MITVRLRGGLGNQMFQYAFGRAVTLKHHKVLNLDLSEYSFKDSKSKRNFDLNNYKLTNEVLLNRSSRQSFVTNKKVIYRLFRKALRLLNKTSFGIFIERSFDYNDLSFQQLKANYYDGYWQSFKYFENIRSILCYEFIPKTIEDEDKLYIKKIENTKSVALHVRRGDYVADVSASKMHGLCTLAYYQDAIRYIANKYNGVHFFLFSDDPSWVIENLTMNYPFTLIRYNGTKRAFMDIYLISRCSHHIIANSSFSWWGAWLSVNREKTIVAPKNWFAKKRSTADLLPDCWIKI